MKCSNGGKIKALRGEIAQNIGVRDDLVCPLCDELILLAQESRDWEGVAFGYVWRADHHFYVTADRQKVSQDLERAEIYINRDKPSLLLEKFYTLRHLLCEVTFDLYSAFRNTLYALSVALALKAHGRVGANYGNLGAYFLDCGCYEEALSYTERAVEALRDLTPPQPRPMRILLTNLVIIYLRLDLITPAKQALERLERLPLEEKDLKLYVDYGYLLYYAAVGDEAQSLRYLQALLDDGLLSISNHAFVVEMMSNAVDAVMRIKNSHKARELLTALQRLVETDEPRPRLAVRELELRYARLYDTEEKQDEGYRAYYALYWANREQTDHVKAEGLRAKVELKAASRQHARSREELDALQELLNYDELTGVHSRRYLKIKQDEILAGIHTDVSFVLLDIDYFKEYNDDYGHIAGDEVLKQVAECLKAPEEERISAFRYGGDEFVCLLRGMNPGEVENYVQQVRARLERKNIEHRSSRCASRVTLSIGYGGKTVINKGDAAVLFDEVDRALYLAKGEGRNTARAIQRWQALRENR